MFGLLFSSIKFALWLFGFGSMGPVAGKQPTVKSSLEAHHITLGSFASFWQYCTGPIAAKSFFATLQSAAMGGSGLAKIAAWIKTVSGIFAGFGLWNWVKGWFS